MGRKEELGRKEGQLMGRKEHLGRDELLWLCLSGRELALAGRPSQCQTQTHTIHWQSLSPPQRGWCNHSPQTS